MWPELRMEVGTIVRLFRAVTVRERDTANLPTHVNPCSGADSNNDSCFSSPLTKGGLRGVVESRKNLPQPLLGKEGGKKPNDRVSRHGRVAHDDRVAHRFSGGGHESSASPDRPPHCSRAVVHSQSQACGGTSAPYGSAAARGASHR